MHKAPVELTVIDRTNHHLFQPLLYQVATAGLSAPAIAAPIRHILRRQRNTVVLMGEVKEIDPAAMSQVRAGRLRPLAVTTHKRTSILPDVPTVAEATGLKDYEVDSWYALFAPAKVPDEVVALMNKAIAAAVSQAEVRAKLLEQGAEATSSTPEHLGAVVSREIAQWRTLVKHARIEGE